MKRLLPLLILALFVFAKPSLASQTENHGLRVLPAPAGFKIDGTLKGWDLTGGIFACGDLEHLRDNSSVWLHAMYDTDNLYLLARWKDPTPLNNPEALGGHGFNGDCFQFRCILFPGTPDQTATWWDGWRDNQGRSVLERSSPGKINGFPDNPLPALENPFDQGAQQAFQIDADGKGYIQELTIPWKMLSASGRTPAVGDRFKVTIEPNFTAGAYGRITIKDIFDDASKAPDRVFTFRSFKDWGWATLMPLGNVDPQPVRLDDARTFPVTMQGGLPTVDWTGLIQHFSWPGFKTINFNMPFDGYVSLNVLDDQGTVVRHLLNQDSRSKGANSVQWDGLTDATYRTPGVPVSAGNFTWKALALPGATVTFRGYAGFGGRAPWQASAMDFWLGDHGVPSSVVTDGQRMYLACNGAEGGRHLIATDFQGNLIWGLQNTTGAGDPEVIAVDNGSVYVVHPYADWIKSSVLISKVDAATGAYKFWDGTKSQILNATDVFPMGDVKQLVGLDAKGGTLYGTTGVSVVLLDGGTGKLKSTIPLPNAGAIKVQDATTAYVVCGSEVDKVNLTAGTAAPFVTGLSNPKSVTVDAQGRVYVSVDDPAHQVVIYDTAGKELGRVGEAGGRQIGPWQPQRMLNPAGICVDPEGKLWVMEHDFYPKRVSVWTNLPLNGTAGTGTMVKEFFGPGHYGCSGGAINPRDPNLMVGEGCEWRLDPATGTAQCLGTFDHNFHDFATYREGSNGRLYLFTNTMRYGTGQMEIWERLGDANYVKRAVLDNTVGGTDQKSPGATELWTDLNNDGQKQPDEVQQYPGALYVSGSNSWSLNLGPDMTLYAYDKSDQTLKSLSPTGFAANGAPKYDLTQLKLLPAAMYTGYQNGYSCAMPSADNKTLLVNLAVKDNPAGFLWEGFDLATGKLKWTYPNPYFQVHGSHLAPAPDPGLFRGAYGPIGTANVAGAGNFWVINGNLGEWWAINADGFYLSRVFSGDVFAWNWPDKPAPGEDFTNLPGGSGGEDFGGSVTQGDDGKVYIEAGKIADWNLTLDGLEKTVSLPGGSLSLSDAETGQALQMREAALQKSAAGSRLTIAAATPTFTGNIDADFKTSDKIAFQKSADAGVRTALAYDATNLYVGWNVKDDTPWVNGAQDISQMYSTGDTVDLQLGTNPNANPKRNRAVAGDLRVCIGNYQGTPTAVLYKFVSDVKKPRTFTSGVIRGYQVDYVDVIPDAVIKVKIDGNRGYTVEAAIPLADLGIKPTSGLDLRGDIGVTHGDPAGQRTRLRTYWANQETGLVDDVVFELQLSPQNWGDLLFQ